MLPPLKRQRAEVCLIVEDSFPFIDGSEASWIRQLIESMPRTKFAIYHIGTGRKKRSQNVNFELPKNVASLNSISIFTEETAPRNWAIPTDAELKKVLKAILGENPISILETLPDLASKISFEKFWKHPRIWEAATAIYGKHFPNEPFAPFLAQARDMFEPLWRLMRDFENLPAADVYQSVGTGYAGLLGAMASRGTQKPFLITEQSISIRDQIGELLRAEWTSTETYALDAFRHLWIEFFMFAARISYETADTIICPFQQNADYQAEFGASPEKIKLVPNGASLKKFEPVRRARTEKLRSIPERTHIGFMGRISPDNDLKTLIQAARLTVDRLPRARFIIAGSRDDESGYFHECRQLVQDLNLLHHVRFSTETDPATVLADLDALVVCDRNAGQSVTILEAFASQLPVVATDVGDSGKLIFGTDVDDFGPAGDVVPTGEARKLSDAILKLFESAPRRRRLGANGRKRVEGRFSEAEMVEAFQKIYDDFCGRITERNAKLDGHDPKEPLKLEFYG